MELVSPERSPPQAEEAEVVMNEQDHARYLIEGKDDKGKLFQSRVGVHELRLCECPPEMVHSFDERSRRNIIEVVNQFGGSVRRIKRVE